MKLIKNAEVYSPDYLGKKDILLANDKIIAIEDQLSADSFPIEIDVIDVAGKIVTPGFVDCHFHLTGGGGEGGYQNRTPEVTLSKLTTAGVTTVVGCLGTDGVGRDMVALISKARGLEVEGISTYLYVGSYHLPVCTVTDSIIKDLLTIDKIIGIGEIAIADHRSSQPSFEEFTRAASEARVGGMLSGKAGIINVHLGDGKEPFKLIERTVDETEIPISQFLPTHINRTEAVFEAAIDYAKRGGYVDFTGSENPEFWEKSDGEVRFSKGLKRLLAEGIAIEQITMTSDGQGSLPYFDENNQFLGLGVGSAKSLLVGIKDAVLNEGIPLETAIKTITKNPATILKLSSKGSLEIGKDADICVLDPHTLDLTSVIAKGQLMVHEQEVNVWGTFEQSY
ncbi:beta-aspartyl-peptidase [Vagococcus xieshaowenii]|uniref:Isoaspartyl dipeptidase n=1 Tax=Vagococcus xieshaowenii TaxID=2562451 RepID=A0AAJ5JLU8_9ENTE|nr:beta-aspartyl-peptidase [Vagococcus xieshaowenii]QCA29614.1 beta-aspartyl-peptidase [Vagococcus xieshaowenii]TFZ41031.1 beta-aspartyl-peptidase [Vagococcus xieshaowenii]